MANKQDRDTYTIDNASLIEDKGERAEQEAENAIAQFSYAQNYIVDFITSPERNFSLERSLILGLHEIAMAGIKYDAGNWRNAKVGISKSTHIPPEATEVSFLVQEMCDDINNNIFSFSPLEKSAYALWRLNWIHPFSDGNGRTSRMVAHIILSVQMKQLLAGKTIAEQITEDKTPYYNALGEADKALLQNNKPNITAMAELMDGMLKKQLLQAQQIATGLAENPGERSFH